MISAVVAIAKNNVIGNVNDLPWYLPADLRHFKELTTGHSVVMGRKTLESIIARLGKPLPNRQNFVITRSGTTSVPDVSALHSPEDILSIQNDLFIIGGAEIYRQTLSMINRLYITEIDAEVAGDTFFPEIDYSQWQEVSREAHLADEKNPYNYSFVVLERIKDAAE